MLPIPAISAIHHSLAAAKARLCAACGMCCDGTMFELVQLQRSDSRKELAALGLKHKHKHGAASIPQPCPAYRGSHCAVYAERPERCRIFECRQLREFAAGESTEGAAQQRIRHARGKVAQLEILLLQLGAAKPSRRRLKQRCDDALAQAIEVFGNPKSAPLRAELSAAMGELEGLLDAHFRV